MWLNNLVKLHISLEYYRAAQIFQIPRSHLKIMGAKSNSLTHNPQILGATVQNVFTSNKATWASVLYTPRLRTATAVRVGISCLSNSLVVTTVVD
jgi:NAD-specific glutamate dehydrogenase